MNDNPNTDEEAALPAPSGSLTRLEEYEMLRDLVILAGNLNSMTNVAQAIIDLQGMSATLRCSEWKSGRKSFMLYLASQPDEFFQENAGGES